MLQHILIHGNLKPNASIKKQIDKFMNSFMPYEIEIGNKLVLYYDIRSKAYYLNCHLHGSILTNKCDLSAQLDGDDDDEIYKLNREITEDNAAFKIMESDAQQGRSFEDLVIEYDTSYRRDKPLKVYGGQHRIKAITNSIGVNDSLHGIRVYFGLDREQKVEIAIVNNTSIAVPNDLLDRMQEQLRGSTLRDWCQNVGLLPAGVDFSDRRSHEIPTVRIARTILVNYYLGLEVQEDSFHQPKVCKSGGIDEDYEQVQGQIDWGNEALLEMGRQFSRLHKVQYDTISNRDKNKNAEFARKAFSLSVTASWAYASGFFQRNKTHLECHYNLTDSVSPPNDPLNAKALSEARLKGVDPDTYRGLGTRNNSTELGRMLEVFLVLSTKATTKKITRQLANAAIQSYQAKRATYQANKELGKI